MRGRKYVWESTFKRFNAVKDLALIKGIKPSIVSKIMPMNLDSSTIGKGDP